jgi:general secretion pathway protein G
MKRTSHMRRVRTARSAFTLIELLLVLVILAVLAGIVVPKFTGRSEDARKTAAKTDISNLSTALNNFELDNGRFPSSEEGLLALLNTPPNAKNWKGPYIESMPKDPWGNDYIYRYPGQHNTRGFDLYSLGSEEREGGATIDNWSSGVSQ